MRVVEVIWWTVVVMLWWRHTLWYHVRLVLRVSQRVICRRMLFAKITRNWSWLSPWVSSRLHICVVRPGRDLYLAMHHGVVPWLSARLSRCQPGWTRRLGVPHRLRRSLTLICKSDSLVALVTARCGTMNTMAIIIITFLRSHL